MSDELSYKREIFVDAYLETWNATEAARRAGYKNPNKLGPRLVKVGEIQARIQERMKEKAMGADEVLLRLSQQATASPALFMKSTTFVQIGAFSQVFEIPSGEIDWDAVMANGHLIKKIAVDGGKVTLELVDNQAALKLMGEHYHLFDEHAVITHNLHVEGLKSLLDQIYGTPEHPVG